MFSNIRVLECAYESRDKRVEELPRQESCTNTRAYCGGKWCLFELIIDGTRI
jgi:hypothetical protein